MTTAAIAGLAATLEISSDGGTTFNKIGECKDITLTVNGEVIDATSRDSQGWKEGIPGLLDWSAEGEAFYVASDVAQDNVYAALTGRTPVKVRFRPKVGTGNDSFTGDALIASWALSAPLGDAASSPISLTGTGPLVRSAQ